MVNAICYLVAITLVIVDLICFALLKLIPNKLSFYYIIPIMILYSCEMLLFLWALHSNNMITLRLIWSIFSIVGLFISSFIIFTQQVNTLHIIAFILGVTSIIIFIISGINDK